MPATQTVPNAVSTFESIQAQLTQLQNEENLTEDHFQRIEVLNTELERLERQEQGRQTLADMTARLGNSRGRQVTPQGGNSTYQNLQTTNHNPDDNPDNANFGFKTAGQYLMALKNGAKTGLFDERVQKVQAAYTDKEGSSAGFLVPMEVSKTIDKTLNTAEESIYAKTQRYTTKSSAKKIFYDPEQPWNQGVKAYWTGEAQEVTESQSKLEDHILYLEKVSALIKISDEADEDSDILQSEIMDKAPTAIMHTVNEGILAGNGIGQPEGVLSSPFRIRVAKEQGQAAKSLTLNNLIDMQTAIHPKLENGLIWVVHQGLKRQIMKMKDGDNRNIALSPITGVQVYRPPEGNQLLGLPVFYRMSTLKEPGTEGDIMLFNPMCIHTLSKMGIKMASSIHVDFEKGMKAFRFDFRVNARCPYVDPIVSEFGNYKTSAIATLQNR